MSSNVMAWQNSFFMSWLPKHKTQYVKFQTSVSLYLYFERNIANWIVNPTWNIVYFRGIWGQTLKLGKMHSSRTHCRKIKQNMSTFKYVFCGIWGQTLRLGKMHSSRTHCRKIKPNMSSFKHLYLCICTLKAILLIGSSIQLEILYIFIHYEVKH